MTDVPEPTPTVQDTLVLASLKLVPRLGESLAIVYDHNRKRHAAKIAQTLEAVADRTGIETLAERLAEPQLEALMLDALDTAGRTGLDAKRRLLAQVLADAVLDDAKVEESQLITQALRDLDAPHIRALERIRLASDTVAQLPEPEKERSEVVLAAGRAEPTPVIAVLIRVGAVEPATIFGGGHGVHDISDFGRNLLDALREDL